MNDVPVRGWHRGNGLGVVLRPDSEQASIRSEQCWPVGTIAMEVIRDAAALTSADGRKVVSLSYTPNSAGNWERVSYLEEGEFFLIFTVSSREQKGFDASAKAYETLISQYREKP